MGEEKRTIHLAAENLAWEPDAYRVTLARRMYVTLCALCRGLGGVVSCRLRAPRGCWVGCPWGSPGQLSGSIQKKICFPSLRAGSMRPGSPV